jgi:hypothetical protein
MPRSRRFLFWLPLVTLTLFFAACGWRNAHLSTNEEDVWAQIPAKFFASEIGTTVFVPPPQPTGHMVDVSDKDAQSVERFLKQSGVNSKTKLVPIKLEEMPTQSQENYPFSWLHVEKPVF